jgi:hypothetical protein
LCFIAVGLVAAEINHAPSAYLVMDKPQDEIVPKVGISRHGLHVQGGVNRIKLQQVRGDRIGFIGIRGAHIVEQDQATVACGIRELQGQTAIAVEQLAFGGYRGPRLAVRSGRGLVRAG